VSVKTIGAKQFIHNFSKAKSAFQIFTLSANIHFILDERSGAFALNMDKWRGG